MMPARLARVSDPKKLKLVWVSFKSGFPPLDAVATSLSSRLHYLSKGENQERHLRSRIQG